MNKIFKLIVQIPTTLFYNLPVEDNIFYDLLTHKKTKAVSVNSNFKICKQTIDVKVKF